MIRWTLALLAAALPGHAFQAEQARRFASHPPMRPLPAPSNRPLEDGPSVFVDAARGDDAGDGSLGKPWRTIARALKGAPAGRTVCLRGGTYYERVTISTSGVTVRSYPGELAILDGGLREFFEDPAGAWKPAEAGAEGEFVSARAHPGLGNARGNFGDSMVPLYPYRLLIDLRAGNEYWNKDFQDGGKLTKDSGIYCGPGIGYDPASGRIHARLAHTRLVLKEGVFPTYQAYRGETDPRKLPLVVAGEATALEIAGAKRVAIRDLVVRGSARATVSVVDAEDIEFDHVTIYGGQPALQARSTRGFRLAHSALRGLSSPWSFRTIKYRGPAPYLFVAAGKEPQNRDFEIAQCEFTDSHDFFLPSVDGLSFHHNVVDNFDDDGFYLSAAPPNERVRIYRNRFSRCLTTFAFYGNHPTGSGVHIFRNVFDLRVPTHRGPPEAPGEMRAAEGVEIPGQARIAGDHGGPVWEPMFAYHNTVLLAGPEDFRTAAVTWGGHTKGTRRRVLNNLFVMARGLPRFLPAPPAADDFRAEGNLHWSLAAPAGADPLGELRRAKGIVESQARPRDRFADPVLAADLTLGEGSAAIDAGVAIPADWPDPLREADGKPDAGALPRGATPWRVGVDGRLRLP